MLSVSLLTFDGRGRQEVLGLFGTEREALGQSVSNQFDPVSVPLDRLPSGVLDSQEEATHATR